MHEPDYAGVDPLRLAETRRRIEAIEAYLAVRDRTTADTIAHAARIGLSRWQFARLVKAWREHRQPRLLVSGRHGPTGRDYGIDATAVLISRDVIAAAGADVELAAAAPEIERLCAEAGVRPPSRPTIWNHIREARIRGDVGVGGPPRVVIGRMWFHLPIAGEDPETMPTLLGAVLLPERAIVAHLLSTDPQRPPSAAGLVEMLGTIRTPGAAARPLLLEAADRRAAAGALGEAGLASVPSYRRSTQRELSRAFGGMLAGLPALYQRGLARPGGRSAAARRVDPAPPAEVVEIVEEAIRASNAGAPDLPPFDISGHAA